MRGSLFLKMLLVFVGAFIAIGVYVSLSYWYFDWDRERLSVQTTAINYADFVLDEVGTPPDTSRGRAVAERLGVGIRMLGPGVDWASTQDFPGFADVDLPAYSEDGAMRAGFSRSMGLSADVVRDDYRYLLALQAGRTVLGSGSTTEDVADAIFMILLLTCVYLLTRRLLRPIRVLSEGVERLRHGDLEVEMHTRRTDELGRLVVSFNEMARAVRERIRARDQLLLDVSHEIRSPLTRMRVALEMAPDSASKRSVIEDIEQTEAMISELLETERLESPHGGLARSRVDLGELLRESVAAFADQRPGVELKGADRPLLLDLDAARIRALVDNVLSNALKYSEPGGEPVRVVVDSTADSVEVSFHDHGVGIASRDLAYVFEPFYRGDPSRSEATGGYGIGLSLAKRIVEAHGGSIEVSSRLGEGTSVLVSFPTSPNGKSLNGPRW